jgi:hypothetical protein
MVLDVNGPHHDSAPYKFLKLCFLVLYTDEPVDGSIKTGNYRSLSDADHEA